jgi:putative membrane protein
MIFMKGRASASKHAICTRAFVTNLNPMDNEKKIILAIAVYAAIMVMIFHSVAVEAQLQDPAKSAIAINEKSGISLVEEEVVDFLVKSADARMMNAQEGLLAIERGQNASIRKYGQLMIKDHSMLLEKIKMLARQRDISLPAQISNRKVGEHQNLSEENGSEFDERFVKMIITDHERDVKLFKKALQSNDPEVSAFAQRYLPLIQSHLDKIKKIKSELKNQ